MNFKLYLENNKENINKNEKSGNKTANIILTLLTLNQW